MNAFKDHFSAASDRYAAYRPDYPAALFVWLAGLRPRSGTSAARDTAWDCATGSGQAALGLAPHFRRVIASDASAEQIRHAAPHPGIEYRVAPAEACGLADRSVDLVMGRFRNGPTVGMAAFSARRHRALSAPSRAGYNFTI